MGGSWTAWNGIFLQWRGQEQVQRQLSYALEATSFLSWRFLPACISYQFQVVTELLLKLVVSINNILITCSVRNNCRLCPKRSSEDLCNHGVKQGHIAWATAFCLRTPPRRWASSWRLPNVPLIWIANWHRAVNGKVRNFTYHQCWNSLVTKSFIEFLPVL